MKWIIKKLHLRGLYNLFIVWLTNHFFSGPYPSTFEMKRKLLNTVQNFEIGEGTKIVGPIYCTGHLVIRDNCWIGKNLRINGNGTVYIDSRCDIGPEVTFQTGGHLIGNAERRAGEGIINKQTVGNGTWIGGRVTIIGNTNIGNGCVVAGCACVTKSIEDNCLIGGVPARVLRRLSND